MMYLIIAEQLFQEPCNDPLTATKCLPVTVMPIVDDGERGASIRTPPFQFAPYPLSTTRCSLVRVFVLLRLFISSLSSFPRFV
jgi:hypothetical protein